MLVAFFTFRGWGHFFFRWRPWFAEHVCGNGTYPISIDFNYPLITLICDSYENHGPYTSFTYILEMVIFHSYVTDDQRLIHVLAVEESRTNVL
mgnify:CR=1 FL=1